MIYTIISILIGAGITWLVSWYYYKRAGDGLKAEADRLQRTNEMILRWLEVDGNNIKIIRDDHGKPVSLARTVNVTDAISVSCVPLGGELRSVTDEPRT
ncbi:hypothetical protein [Pseudoxanthomonas wuyuanensis]|uniref:hypothetical protein n=1 Tax=Pseudoxanthomonas wuyuanensis TaxID=1073196 RepID=UPI00114219FD|nr:hypothetical protein [Pseudoxanthomonas wuyuanensis]